MTSQQVKREPDAPESRRRSDNLRYLVSFLRANPAGLFGLCIIAVLVLCALLAPLIVPYDPEEVRGGSILEGPSSSHWFGTDSVGLDVFSRVVSATRVDLPIAVGSTVVALVLGVILGVATGYFGGRGGVGGALSEALLRVLDVLQAFPVFIFALALVAAAGPSSLNVGIAITFVATPAFLRLIRGQVLSLREMPFVEAARCGGAGPLRIAFVHLLPGVLGPALIQASITVGFAILLTSGLSFVGAGVAPPTPEWGLMIANGAQHVTTGQWWTYIFPGGALALSVLGFALAGEAVGRLIDPRQRR